MTLWNRRKALGRIGALAVSSLLSERPVGACSGSDATLNENRAAFSFVHITDIHIGPERDAVKGVARAFAHVRSLPEKPAFALIGGDLVDAAVRSDKKRADMLYDLWQTAAEDIGIPAHYSLGNADLVSVLGDGRLAPENPEYGKKGWQKRLNLAQRFGHFDHNGWRFILLDSVQTDGNAYWGEVDSEQRVYLDNLLRKTDPKQPIVILTHIPILTAYGLYTSGTTKALSQEMIVRNGKEIVEMLQSRQVVAVLQGHTHVVEECAYAGVRYITGGAVCGEWWRGKRLGIHPEGFGVCTVSGNTLTYRYQPYGWQAVAEPAGGAV